MIEHHIRVTRTARYITLGDVEHARSVWFVLHGYAQLASRFARRFEGFVRDDRAIIAPEALNRYYFESAPGVHAADAGIGATWMTREDRETDIADYVEYLDTLWDAVRAARGSSAEIVALGFSQGSATAARWCARGHAEIDRLVLWGGFMPPEIELSAGALRGARVTLIHGLSDRYASAEKVNAESARLHAGGIANEVVAFDGGHEVNAAGLAALERENL